MRPTASGGAGHQHKKEARTWSLGPAAPRLPGLTPPHVRGRACGDGPSLWASAPDPTLGVSTASQAAPGLQPLLPRLCGAPTPARGTAGTFASLGRDDGVHPSGGGVSPCGRLGGAWQCELKESGVFFRVQVCIFQVSYAGHVLLCTVAGGSCPLPS